MSVPELMDLTSQSLLLVLYLSLPPIIAAAAVGTLVALLQALTQVQEQTLTFAVKLFVVSMVIFATASWLGHELYHYGRHVFGLVGELQNT
ncbi:MAG: type III secretion system export apparatus subunit SctS [Pseudomonadota bacterium]